MEDYNVIIPILQRLCNLERKSISEGNSFICGTGAPSSTTGNVNDIYLDLSSSTFYNKTPNGWYTEGTLSVDGGVF